MTSTIMAEKDGVVEDRALPESPARNKPHDFPPEGPHARPDLINEDATPGTGLFSGGQKSADKDVDPGAG